MQILVGKYWFGNIWHFCDLFVLTLSSLSEDLVLAEERTSKKDRQRIMEGEFPSKSIETWIIFVVVVIIIIVVVVIITIVVTIIIVIIIIVAVIIVVILLLEPFLASVELTLTPPAPGQQFQKLDLNFEMNRQS